MELAGRHIVVTGGASGIGRACALRFADEDAKVTVSDLDDEGAERDRGARSGGHAVQADVGQEQDILGLIEQAEASTARSTPSSPTPASPARPAARRTCSTTTGTCSGA